MDEVTFQKKLSELMAQIDTLPEGERDRIRSLANETRQRHADIKKSVDQMQESLDFRFGPEERAGLEKFRELWSQT